MELNLITGRAGSGKSRFCVENISGLCQQDPERPVFLLVPEQFTVQAERRLLEAIPSGGVLNNEVLSFKRLRHRVLSQYGGVTKKVLDPSGRSMVLAHAFRLCEKQLTYYKSFSRQLWQVDKVMSLITELVRYGISPGQLSDLPDKIKDKPNAEELTVKLRELSLVYTQYKNLLQTDYVDELDMHRILLDKLTKEKPFAGAVVWVDEFTGFTTLEIEILEALLKQCACVNVCLLTGKASEQLFQGVNYTRKLLMDMADRCGCPKHLREIDPAVAPRFAGNPALTALEREFGRYPCTPYTGRPEHIRINQCSDLHSEVYNSALEIQRLCTEEGLRFRDISVTVRDIEAYREIIAAVYPLMGISYFMDDRMSLDRHPLTAFALDALDIVAQGFRYDSVFSFLKSGYYPCDRAAVDRLENIMLARGIRTRSGWEKPVDDPECEALRQDFMGKMDVFYEALREASCYREALLALCDLLDRLRPDRSDRVWTVITQVFGQLADFLGDQPCGGIARTAEELRLLLKNGFAKYSVGSLPEDADCVPVGAADRSRTREIKALLVLGANEGVFPASFKDNGLLSDRERELIREQGVVLSETIQARAFLEPFLIYRTLTAPQLFLYVSYALDRGDGGRGRPSWLIRRMRKILPEVLCEKGEPVSGFGGFEAPELTSRTEAYLSEDVAEELFRQRDGTVASVSGMEKYRACPFSFFAERGLRAEERKQYTVESFDTGSFLHLLLEYGTRKLMETGGEVSREDCAGIIRQISAEAVEALNNPAITGTAKNRFLTDRLIRFARESLYAVACQCRDGAYQPYGFEVAFGYPGPDSLPPLTVLDPDGQPVRIKGKIDRCDFWDHEGVRYFRIIDYKSSAHSLKPGEAYDGRKMQLVTYMDAVETALEEEGKKPVCGGVFYFNIPTGRTETPDYTLKGLCFDDRTNIEAMTGETGHGGLKVSNGRVTGCKTVPEGGFDFLKQKVRAHIGEVTASIRQGKIPADPVGDVCRYCRYQGVCGFQGTPRTYHPTEEETVWDLKKKEE